jgi:DNA replication and repair protein RecF
LHIARLSLVNFRNYRHMELPLPPHVTVLKGDNAQGKTNMMEAIHMLATTKSHRASSDRELVSHEAMQEATPFTRLTAEIVRPTGDLEVDILLRLEGSALSPDHIASVSPSPVVARKQVRVNGILRRPAEMVGQVTTVIFGVQDIDLITGAPALCRRYLDLVSSQIDPVYLRSLQRYNRVLLQRNHLLRQIQENKAQSGELEFWDTELVQSGCYLVERRHSLIESIDNLAREVHLGLSGGAERLQVVYQPSTGTGDTSSDLERLFRKALHHSKRREAAQGVTVVGPHRDSLQFLINGMDAGKYGSRGQQHTVALSLRLAEARHLRNEVRDAPVLLLDDVFSELDPHRRKYLLESITLFQQVIISTIEMDYFRPSFLSRATLFRVRQGEIEALQV